MPGSDFVTRECELNHHENEAVANRDGEEQFGDAEPDYRKPSDALDDRRQADPITGNGANHIADRILNAVAFVVDCGGGRT